MFQVAPQGDEKPVVNPLDSEQAHRIRKSKKMRTVAVVIVSVLLVLLVFASALTSQDFVCAGCHSIQKSALENSAHNEKSCYDCHLNGGAWRFSSQKAREWFVMYPHQMSKDKIAFVGQAQIDNDTCLECHTAVGLVAGGSERGIKIDHDTCVATFQCTACHIQVAHGTTITQSSQLAMEQCQQCHKRDFRQKNCTRCHEKRDLRDDSTSKAWRATHGENWRTTHGMGNLDSCSACHEDKLCESCHKTPIPHRADFGQTHGATAQKYPDSCTTCHKAQNFCESCHGIEMPHPKSFLKTHSSLVKQRSDEVCMRCHTQDGCDECHVQHTHPAGPKVKKQDDGEANK